MQDIKIIGLAGTNGSGKDAAGKIVADTYGYMFISVTDLLRDELGRRHLPPARQEMRELSAEWRRQSGSLGVLVDKAVAAYRQVEHAGYNGLIIASMRNPGEADRVHELGGLMVWIDAAPRIRYDRVQASAHSRGSVRAIDDQKSFEQFLADEAAEMHKQTGADEATLDMAAVKDRCDVFITNDSDDLTVFTDQIRQSLHKWLSK